jgi:hypothetical protein
MTLAEIYSSIFSALKASPQTLTIRSAGDASGGGVIIPETKAVLDIVSPLSFLTPKLEPETDGKVTLEGDNQAIVFTEEGVAYTATDKPLKADAFIAIVKDVLNIDFSLFGIPAASQITPPSFSIKHYYSQYFDNSIIFSITVGNNIILDNLILTGIELTVERCSVFVAFGFGGTISIGTTDFRFSAMCDRNGYSLELKENGTVNLGDLAKIVGDDDIPDVIKKYTTLSLEKLQIYFDGKFKPNSLYAALKYGSKDESFDILPGILSLRNISFSFEYENANDNSTADIFISGDTVLCGETITLTALVRNDKTYLITGMLHNTVSLTDLFSGLYCVLTGDSISFPFPEIDVYDVFFRYDTTPPKDTLYAEMFLSTGHGKVSINKSDNTTVTIEFTDLQFSFNNLPFIGKAINELQYYSISNVSASYIHDTHSKVLVKFDFITPSETKTITLNTGDFSADSQLLTAKNSDTAMYYAINKQFGCVDIAGVTVRLSGGRVLFGLDASLALGKLVFSLDNLYIGYDIQKRSLVGGLDGLSAVINAPPLTVGGGLKRVSDDEYAGELTIGVRTISLQLLAIYDNGSDYKSLVAYLCFDAPMGGPPCFFITGIRAGMGYNRLFVPGDIRNIDKLIFFDENGKDAQNTLKNADTVFPKQSGEYFLAAGLNFTVFNMVDGKLVAAINFGTSTSFTLLGTAVLTVPFHDKNSPIAKAELLINATVNSEYAFILGQLSDDSFILSRACRLTGGFAFYTWYSGAHSGDFTITLGGYPSFYAKPEYYPLVPRVGFDWRISGELDANGEIYFALTPGSVMAGGSINCRYSAGCISAGFSAYIDVLMNWKPYHYEIDAGITIWAKADLWLFTIRFELGCDLNIWGPDFSGKARIHFGIVKFTIHFGDSDNSTPTISTDEFGKSFIKKPVINKSYIKGGNASDGFMITTIASAPVSKAMLNDREICPEGSKYGLKPCGISDFASTHSVVITDSRGEKIKTESVSVTVVQNNLPASLWGNASEKNETIAARNSVSLVFKNTVKDEQGSLCSALLPALADGKYNVAVTDTSNHLPTQEAKETFLVQGERFAISDTAINTVYPIANSNGDYTNILPHIVWTRQTFPWEVQPPFVALIVLHSAELADVQTGSLHDFLTDGGGINIPSIDTAGLDTNRQTVNYIEIGTDLFNRIRPSSGESALLSHGRKNGSGEYQAYTIANRFPVNGKNRVYAVSLEGMDGIDKGKSKTRVLVFYRWEFNVQASNMHFEPAIRSLDNKPLSPAYTLNSVTKSGRRGLYSYAGAISPKKIPYSYTYGHMSADDLYEEKDNCDVSCAVAWQNGRLITLSDKNAAMEILRNRAKICYNNHTSNTYGLRTMFNDTIEILPERVGGKT